MLLPRSVCASVCIVVLLWLRYVRLRHRSPWVPLGTFMVYYCSCRRKQVFGFYIIDLRRSLVIIVVEASSVQSAKLDFQNNMKRIRKLLKTETSIDLKVSKSRSRRFSLDPSLSKATVAPINLPPTKSSVKSSKINL